MNRGCDVRYLLVLYKMSPASPCVCHVASVSALSPTLEVFDLCNLVSMSAQLFNTSQFARIINYESTQN